MALFKRCDTNAQLKNYALEECSFKIRCIVASVLILVGIMILIARLCYLQIFQHKKFSILAHNNQVRIIPLAPTRGLIYDRNGILLAENIPAHHLELVTYKIKNLEQCIEHLSSIIDIPKEEKERFYKRLRYSSPFTSIPLRKNLTEEEVAKFSVKKYLFTGVDIVSHLVRYYPYGQLTAHVLGYMAPINKQENIDIREHSRHLQATPHAVGRGGIEQTYELHLYGESGYQQIETDVRGRILRPLYTKLPQSGKNLHLSIDIRLQQLAYEAIGNKIGALVAIEPKTGEVLALASNPSFDPNIIIHVHDDKQINQLFKSRLNPMFNRAISGQYPPGSTVKPIIALYALQHKIINKKDFIYDPGYFQIDGEQRRFRDWKNHGHDWVNVEKAIVESCTTYFYHLAHKLGIDTLYNIFSEYQLGQKTGIELPQESAGLVPSRQWKQDYKQQIWFPGETLNVGIGQGYTLVTPLQMANLTAILANQGYNHPVTLLHKGHKKSDTYHISQISPNHWTTIIQSMLHVISKKQGTAHKIFNTSLPSIAGKTGTVQVFTLSEDKTSLATPFHLHDHSWFIAFMPIIEPKVVIAVILENQAGSSLVVQKWLKGFEHLNKNRDI